MTAEDAPSGPSRRGPARHSEIEALLRGEIAAGLYPVGTCLPGEHALCDRFRASRFTVRQALRALAQTGLVDARPGIGTVVIAAERRDAFVQTLGSVEELLQYPPGTGRLELEATTVEAPPEIARTMECAPGAPLARLRAIRVLRESMLPIAWLEAHLSPRFADVLERPNPDGAPLLRQIEAAYGHRASSAQVEIRADHIGPDQAGPLMAEEGSPALVIRRRYRGPDGLIYLLTHSTHPESRFSLNFEFEKK